VALATDLINLISNPIAAAQRIALEVETVIEAAIGSAVYLESSFSATFDHSVGVKTVVVRKFGKKVTLEIPLGAITDGVGTVCASGATDVPAAYRPAADITFPALVIDNGSTRKAGQVKITAAGKIEFSVLGAGFTNAAAAGWDRTAVTFSLA
jgi:hypothetical protein